MHFAQVLFAVLLAAVAAKSQTHQAAENTPYYPFYQRAVPEPRWNLVFSESTSYIATTTSTVSTTCTVYTSSTCASGRRRRFIEWSDDEQVAPSAVEKYVTLLNLINLIIEMFCFLFVCFRVETTAVADIESVRNAREADPQFYVASPYAGPYYHQPFYGVPSTLDSSFPSFPYYGYPYGPYPHPQHGKFFSLSLPTITITLPIVKTSTVRLASCTFIFFYFYSRISFAGFYDNHHLFHSELQCDWNYCPMPIIWLK